MSRRPLRPLLLALLLLAVVAAAVFGVSGGLASSARSSAPASATSKYQPNAPAETIQQCLKDLAYIEDSVNRLRKIRQDVLAKRTYLYTTPATAAERFFGGKHFFVPVSADEYTDFLTSQLLTGGINSRQLVFLVRTIRQMTANNLPEVQRSISELSESAQRTKKSCDELRQGTKPPPPKPPAPPPQAGSFTLVGQLPKTPEHNEDDIKNPNAIELTIKAPAMEATDDHKAELGGGQWKVTYTWELPQTLTPGEKASVTLRIKVESNPGQNQFGLIVIAPGLTQQLLGQKTVEQTYEFTVPEGSKEPTITIRLLSAEVIYHYRRGG